MCCVAIDDETVRQEGKYPLARGTLARLVDRLSTAGASVIGLDILLLDQGDEDQDAALAASLSAARVVVAGAATFSAGRQRAPASADPAFDGVPVADSFVLPLDRFARAAAVGVVNVSTDYAGTPRLAPMVFRTADTIEASFPLQVASRALGAPPVFEAGGVLLGDRRIATDFGQRLPIGYYGPRGTIETVSAAAVLGGALPPARIAGRIVVIGATVIGSGDVFPTPFDPVFPGVEVISTAVTHLVAGDGPVRNSHAPGGCRFRRDPADDPRRTAGLAKEPARAFRHRRHCHPLARREPVVLQQWRLAGRGAAADISHPAGHRLRRLADLVRPPPRAAFRQRKRPAAAFPGAGAP